MRWQDWTITAGILLLAALMPIAIGGTLAAAYIAGEAIVFAMLGLWCIELWRSSAYPSFAKVRALALPIAGLVVYGCLQLIPLPPSVLRVVSPKTYQVYARAFPDWPRVRPYPDWRETRTSSSSAPQKSAPLVLPTLSEVRAGAAVPFAPSLSKDSMSASSAALSAEARPRGLRAAVEAIYGTRWRPLTISPPQTFGALIALVACVSLFMVGGFFPIGGVGNPQAELSFLRVVCVGLMAIGTTIAALGLVQFATWNGKILWVYVPRDWGAPGFFESVRASGPFVNPDHFAGFLAMLYPIAISGALFRSALVPTRWSAGFRVVCISSAFLIFAAVLMSQSRAGWIGIAVGTTLVAVLSLPSAGGSESRQVGFGYWRAAKIALGTLAVMLVLATVFVGADSMVETGTRAHSSLSDVRDVAGRLDAWRAGLRIVRDFPLTGIGLGSWAEIFAHYARAPWTENYFYEAENDYLQYVAETGLIGLIFGGWLVYRIAGLLARRRARLSTRMRPVAAALVAGIAAMAVIEFFDFDLQLPANAFLFATILGLAVRIASRHDESGLPNEANMRANSQANSQAHSNDEAVPSDLAQLDPRRRFAGLTGATAAIFLVACVLQPGGAYPYNLTAPRSWPDARRMLILYPANPYSHASLIFLARTLGESMDRAASMRELQTREIETRIWLDPTSPYARDTYANRLWSDGRTREALEQITLSVFNSPSAETHRFLSPRLIAWLTPASRQAIEQGYKLAVEAGFNGACTNLGSYYEILGRYSDEASMYKRAAEREQDSDAKYQLLVQAGRAAALAREESEASGLLRQALEIDPSGADAYASLIVDVFGQTDDVAGITRTVTEATRNGVDPYQIWLTAARAEIQMNQYKAAEEALNNALKYRPGSIDDMVHLASLYLQTGDHDSAVRLMERAVRMRQNSADAYYTLALADEAAYNYADAGKAYSRALELAPRNLYYQRSFAEFKKRLEKPADESSNAR